jgi:hypothetical protein
MVLRHVCVRLLVDSFTTAASLVILWRYLRGDAWRDPWYAWMLVACATAVSVARTGLPHTNHTPASTQPAPGIAGVALNRTPSSNNHRHPAELALALPQDRTPGADHDPAAAANVRQQVRALVARERSGGPKVTAAEVVAVTGRSRRRAYELLRDARTEQE